MYHVPVMELENVRVFDVLRNALNGELAVVMSVSGDRLDLRTKTGETVRFKFGEHFTRVSDDEAVAFRAALRELRKQQETADGKKKKKRTPRSVAALLKRLSNKKRRV